MNNLTQIGRALQSYHAAEGCLPPAYLADEDGTPMHSWRTLILPYLEMRPLHDRYDFDQPWHSPANRSVTGSRVPVYRCPSDDLSDAATSYVMVVGPGTISDGTSTSTLGEAADKDVWTAMAVEVVDSGIHWSEPRDLDVEALSYAVNVLPGGSVSSNHPGGAVVLFANGGVRFVSEETSGEMLEKMATWPDREADISGRMLEKPGGNE